MPPALSPAARRSKLERILGLDDASAPPVRLLPVGLLRDLEAPRTPARIENDPARRAPAGEEDASACAHGHHRPTHEPPLRSRYYFQHCADHCYEYHTAQCRGAPGARCCVYGRELAPARRQAYGAYTRPERGGALTRGRRAGRGLRCAPGRAARDVCGAPDGGRADGADCARRVCEAGRQGAWRLPQVDGAAGASRGWRLGLLRGGLLAGRVAMG